MHFIYGYGNNNWGKKGGWKAAGKKRPNSSKRYDAGGLFLLINSLFNLFEDFFVIKKHKHNLFRSSIHAQTLNGWRPQWKCLFFSSFLFLRTTNQFLKHDSCHQFIAFFNWDFVKMSFFHFVIALEMGVVVVELWQPLRLQRPYVSICNGNRDHCQWLCTDKMRKWCPKFAMPRLRQIRQLQSVDWKGPCL